MGESRNGSPKSKLRVGRPRLLVMGDLDSGLTTFLSATTVVLPASIGHFRREHEFLGRRHSGMAELKKSRGMEIDGKIRTGKRVMLLF